MNLSYAWNSKTHSAIVEKLYYSVPSELESKLNLELMKNGSTAPDLVFHDQRTHHYPSSYNKTIYWLEKAKEEIKNNDYENASYSFGVATHYISDSVIAPHYVEKEDAKLHTKFEYQITEIKTKCNNNSYNINKTLEKASIENQKDWYSWLKNQDKEIPEKELDQAMNIIYSLFLETFNTHCEEKTTNISYSSFSFNSTIIIYIIIMIIAIVFILKFSKN
nr:phospholipase [Nanoarchaeum sp.]